MNIQQKLGTGAAVFVAVLMVLSVATMPVAAADGDIVDAGNAPFTPEDVPANENGVSQNIFTEANDFSVDNTGTADPTDISLRIDVSDLQNRADLSGADVTVDTSAIQNVGSGDVNLAAYSDGIIFLSVAHDGSGNANLVFNSGAVTLTGIDTTGTDTVTGLDYVVRSDFGQFDPQADSFSADDISTSDSFDIAQIVLADSQGNTQTVASLSQAFTTDQGPLSDSADNEIRIGSGTYNTDSLTVPNDKVTIKPLDGANVTLVNQNGGTTISTNDKNDVAIEDIAFNQDDQNQQAIAVQGAASETVTLSGNTFENLDNGGTEVVDIDDEVSEVTVSGNTFDDDSNAATGIGFSNDDDATTVDIDNNEFVGLSTAVAANGGTDDDDITITNNVFEDNTEHVENGQDIELNAVFADNGNDFSGKFAIVRDTSTANNDIRQGIFGTLDAAETDGTINNVLDDSNQRVVVAGEHDLSAGNTLDTAGSATGVTLTGAGENATIVEDGATTLVDVSGNSMTNLEISGLTFDLDDGGTSAIIAGSNTDTGLVISENEFLNANGGDNVIDFQGTDNIQDVEVSDNTFDSDNSYTAVAFADNVLANSGSDEAVVSGNTIDGATEGVNLGQTDDSSLVISIDNNEFLNITNGQNSAGVFVNDYQNSGDELTISSNTFSAADGENVDGLQVQNVNIGSGPTENIAIEQNTFSGVDDGSGSGTALFLGSPNNDIAVSDISDNTFEANAEHFDATAGGYSNSDITTLINNNEFGDTVFVSGTKQSTDVSDLEANRLHGTIEAAEADADASGEFVNVGPGTYDESGITTSQNGVTIVSVDGADQTTITSSADADILDIESNNVVVDGFTFAPQVDNANADLRVSSGAEGVEVLNSTFSGVSDFSTREAVAIADNNDDQTIVRNVEVSNYAVGIAARGGSTDDPTIEDSTITSNDIGVFVGSSVDGGTPSVVRSVITDNRVGVDLRSGTQNTIVNFNDITDNADAGIRAPGEDINTALANFYGDAAGPNVSTVTGADIVVSDTDNINDEQTRPFLDESISTLPEKGLVLVTDPSNPAADGDETTVGGGALLLVASLDDTEAGNLNAGDITLSVTDGPSSLNNINRFTKADGGDTPGAASAADPIRISSPDPDDGTGDNTVDQSVAPIGNEDGDYTIGVFDTGDTANSGSAVQTFTAPVDSVEVTSDVDELAADGDTEATITLQLVDANGDPVPRSGVSTSFAIDNSADAGTERVSTNNAGSTNADGEATLSVTADTAGETFTVTGIDTDNDNSDTVSIDTVEQAQANFSVEFVDGPTTITQNESYSATVNVTNEGDAAGTQDITYNLEDSAGISQLSATEEDVQLNASASQEVTFEVAAADTQSLSTDDGFAHVFESDDDTLTIENITVEEAVDEQPPTATVTFDDQTVTNGSTSVDVASATFNRSENFVIVVHRASPGDNGVVDGTDEIGNKIGSSDVLTNNTVSDVPVNLTKNLDEGGNTQLTENQTLIAMLHFANESGDTNFGSPIVRDGTPVFDQADITIEPESPIPGVPGRFDENADGEIDIGELGQAGQAFAQGDLTITELGEVGQAFAS